MRQGVLILSTTLATTSLALLGASSSPPRNETPDAGCQVRGVWELVSRSVDGQDRPLAGFRERKVVTADHFMWVAHAGRRDTLPFNTELERLRALQFEGGAGTYTTSGNTYIEHIELYDYAREIGTSFRATCRIVGDRWYHSFTLPNDTAAATGPILHFVQVYRRIE
jgi:hypothetical protein